MYFWDARGAFLSVKIVKVNGFKKYFAKLGPVQQIFNLASIYEHAQMWFSINSTLDKIKISDKGSMQNGA